MKWIKSHSLHGKVGTRSRSEPAAVLKLGEAVGGVIG